VADQALVVAALWAQHRGMIRLFEHPLSSYCQKAKTAFYEHGVPFERVMLDGSEPAASEFRTLWPIGKFPLAVDGDRVIPEATTIIEYLDVHHAGAGRLIPDDRGAAIEVRQLDRFFDNYVNGPQQRIVLIAIGRDGGDEVAFRAQLETAYAWLEDWLGTREWVAGRAFSLADCAAAPALLYADWTHAIPAGLTRVHAYRTRLLARPSYARALDEARPYRHMFPLGAPAGRD
jgi:glutathione S-transferase